jgi:glyoxylase-like metal-dependent hydrolase (beta-lactamase superfamily II)
MKAIIPAILAALLMLVQNPAQAQQDFSKVEIMTTDLGHGMYMLEGGGGNITVAATADGAIMVDTQFAPLSAKIKAAIAKVSPQPVRYVIDTHYHPDHTGGNANFARDGAVIVAHENVRKRLTANPQTAAGALPAMTFEDGIVIHLGDKTAEVHHMAPAHTDGDSYVYFPAENVLATGDIFGSFRFPTGDVRGGGDVDGMLASANRLLTLVNEDTKIVPGHGPLAKRADLIEFRNMVQDSRDRVAKLIAEGKSVDDVVRARPLADWYAKRGGDDMRTDAWVRYVYQSLKSRPG